MDLNRVKYLMQVADLGNFSRAATVIGIAQPSLSRQVQKLENEYGARLLYRHGRGVSLTPAGEAFLDEMRPLVRQIDMAVNRLRDQSASPSGEITLGLTPTVSKLIGMPLLTSLRRKFPRLRLNVVSGYSGYVHEWLASARVDLAILHDARRSQYVAVQHIADMQLYLMSAPHVLAPAERLGKSAVPLLEIPHLPLVLPTHNHGLRRTMEAAAGMRGVKLNIQYEMDNLDLMCEIAAAGLAHATLALPAAREELASGRLLARPIVEPVVMTRLMMVKASNRPITHAVKLVEQEVCDVFRRVLADPTSDLGIQLAPELAGRG